MSDNCRCCAADMRGSDHCPACYCEAFEETCEPWVPLGSDAVNALADASNALTTLTALLPQARRQELRDLREQLENMVGPLLDPTAVRVFVGEVTYVGERA